MKVDQIQGSFGNKRTIKIRVVKILDHFLSTFPLKFEAKISKNRYGTGHPDSSQKIQLT